MLTSPQLGGTFLGSHWKYQAQVGTGTFRCCPLIPRSEPWRDSETRCIDTGSQGCSVLHPSGLPLVCLQMLVPRVWRNGPRGRGLQSFLPLSLFACLIISESNTRHVVKSELTSAGKGRRLVGEEIERRESVRHFRQCCHRTNSCLPVKLSDDLFLSERFGICCSDLDDRNDISPVWF